MYNHRKHVCTFENLSTVLKNYFHYISEFNSSSNISILFLNCHLGEIKVHLLSYLAINIKLLEKISSCKKIAFLLLTVLWPVLLCFTSNHLPIHNSILLFLLYISFPNAFLHLTNRSVSYLCIYVVLNFALLIFFQLFSFQIIFCGWQSKAGCLAPGQILPLHIVH